MTVLRGQHICATSELVHRLRQQSQARKPLSQPAAHGVALRTTSQVVLSYDFKLPVVPRQQPHAPRGIPVHECKVQPGTVDGGMLSE